MIDVEPVVVSIFLLGFFCVVLSWLFAAYDLTLGTIIDIAREAFAKGPASEKPPREPRAVHAILKPQPWAGASCLGALAFWAVAFYLKGLNPFYLFYIFPRSRKYVILALAAAGAVYCLVFVFNEK